VAEFAKRVSGTGIEMQQCPNCRELVELANRFCSSCGSQMPVPAPVQMVPPAPVQNFPPQPQEYQYLPHFVKEPRKKMSGRTKKVIAGVLSFVLVGSVAGVVIVRANAPKIFAETLSADEIRQVSARVCDSVLSDIQYTSDYLFAEVVPSRIRSLNNVTGDYWETKDFKAKNNSWFYRDSSYDVLQSKISSSIESNSQGLFDRFADGKYSGAYAKNMLAWNSDLFYIATNDCNFRRTLDTLLNYDSALSEAKNVLANAPWYPRGFSEIPEYPGFAYKNSGGYCSYTFGSCAKFKIISNSSCASNLYIQANLSAGGSVIDWGNDSVSVGAYQVADIEIYFSSERSGTYEITTINCRP
jgi:hypothetical protein